MLIAWSKPWKSITKKQENSRKMSTSISLTMLKPLTVWTITNCGKFLKRQEYQTTLPVSWETWMQVKKQQLEFDMEELTGSKLGKKFDKAIYCHPVYLISMQSISCKIPGWMNQSQARIKIARRNINSLRYADDTILMAESEEELKSFLRDWKRRVKKLA